jgi:hypothetical protein
MVSFQILTLSVATVILICGLMSVSVILHQNNKNVIYPPP